MMKKLLYLLLSLLSLHPIVATDNKTLQQCIGATTLLLSSLSKLDNIKERESAILSMDVLKKLKKDLKDEQNAEDLYMAIDNKDYTKAIQLLDNNPNLHINAGFDNLKFTSLMKCCMNGDESFAVARKILNHPKLDITIENKYGQHCLHYLCSCATPKIGRIMFKKPNINTLLNKQDNKQQTPLDWVIYRVKAKSADIKYVTVWNMMVKQGATLNKFKTHYNNLKSSAFTEPYSDYVDLIKGNPPNDDTRQEKE